MYIHPSFHPSIHIRLPLGILVHSVDVERAEPYVRSMYVCRYVQGRRSTVGPDGEGDYSVLHGTANPPNSNSSAGAELPCTEYSMYVCMYVLSSDNA